MSLGTPWREMDIPTWDYESLNILKKEIEEYVPLREMSVSEDALPHINILLLGQVEAGKSSFFNTLNSIFHDRLSIQARAGRSDRSLTKSFNVYSIISNKRILRFRICDSRGFEDTQGDDLFDIKDIVDGNIKNKYKFVEKLDIEKESPFYRRDPKINDRIHCVAIVVDATKDPDHPIAEHVQEQIRKTQELMNLKGVPQLILMNKIDGLSESIKGGFSSIFHSQEVKRRVEKLANYFRLPPNTVLPMKNFDIKHHININFQILALYNLRQMLRAADDYLLNNLEEIDEFGPSNEKIK
ncbi:interferon-induced protein 44-like isoform X2 [Mytilus galloprovincialis]